MHLTFVAVSLKPITVFFYVDSDRVFMHFTFVTPLLTRIAVPFFLFRAHYHELYHCSSQPFVWAIFYCTVCKGLSLRHHVSPVTTIKWPLESLFFFVPLCSCSHFVLCRINLYVEVLFFALCAIWCAVCDVVWARAAGGFRGGTAVDLSVLWQREAVVGISARCLARGVCIV